jgi:hypothetical protein
MKKFYSIIRNIFAIIGILAVIAGIIIWIIEPKYDVYIDKNNYGLLNKRVELLRTSGEYAADTNVFEMKIAQNEMRAQEIRDYFQLDTLYPENATTWEKTVAIGKFVSSNIPHANQRKWPKDVNAIGLWEYIKEVEPAFNCRLHSIFAFELFLSADIKARYITCMSEDKDDPDCHVVNEVWLPELNKWAMVDTDMGGHYVTDKNGTPLSLQEMREHYISGEKMLIYPAFGKAQKDKDYYAYMAKNTYWFSCWGTLSYYQEDYKVEGIDRNSYVNLIPSGYTPYGIDEGYIVTTDAEKFWDATMSE